MNAGYSVVIVDNLINSHPAVLERMRQLCNGELTFVQADVRDRTALDRIFLQHDIESVVHFAGLKSVAESVAQPLLYADNNVSGTVSLLQAMARADVRKIVFSSSATVYGDADTMPISESAPLHASNPYGRSKLVCEELLRDLQNSDSRWQIAILRYFNPVGAHPSGMIGESSKDTPSNLMPYITQVATGQREVLNIFGHDYPTPDGTGVRDYIHVMDLARGHLAALNWLEQSSQPLTVNLGTGHGVSVQQLADTFAQVSGRPIARRYTARRPGDVAVCYADTTFAVDALGWRAELSVAQMCEDAWRWQSMNPNGYAGM